MKTKKTVFFALFALTALCATIILGCDEPPASLITFTVTPNTPSGKNTASLEIKFAEAVPGLTAADISISGSNVQKGSLSGSGQTYSLGITVTGFAGPVQCSVTITKAGVSPSAVNVNGVVNAEGLADFTLSSTKISAADKKAELTITLTKSAVLTADQITLTKDSGEAMKGALTGSGTSWTLGVTAIKAGEIKVKIDNSQVNDAEKSVSLDDGSTTPPPGSGIPVYKIDIRPKEDGKYRTDYSDNQVEMGYDREYIAFITPTNATIQTVVWDVIDPSVATITTTVDSNGKVNCKVSARFPYGETYITAKSTDGSNVGFVFKIETMPRELPDKLIIGTDGNGASGQVTAQHPVTSPISLILGDAKLLLTTELQNAFGTRTNDQSVIFTFSSTSYFTFEKLNPEDKDGDVPRGQFTLTPTAVTPGSPGQTITLTSAYQPATKEVLTVTVEAKTIANGDITVAYKNSDGTTLTPATTNKPEISPSGTIIVVVKTKYPYKDVTLSIDDEWMKTFASITSSEVKSPIEKWFYVKVAGPPTWGSTSNNIFLTLKVTDYASNTPTVWTPKIELMGK